MASLIPPGSALLVTVSKFPGIRFRELGAKTGLANGTLAYRLGLLEKKGLLRVERGPRFTSFYPTDFSPEDSRIFALVRQNRSREIMSLLLKAGHATHGEIASHLRVAPSTASWYLGRLTKSGVLAAEPLGRETIYAVATPNRVLRLLSLHRSTWQENVVSSFVSAWEDLSI